MNLSWESVRKIVDFYKVPLENWIVVYDDFSLEFWKIRFRDKGSAGWHNGVKDMIKHFWESFKRIKVWIWLNEKYEISDWVLSKFREEELIELENEVYGEVFKVLKEKL
jgi:PTH1 family peptidyl-tRNA hydrolase